MSEESITPRHMVLGANAEHLAAEKLQEHNYQLLDTNWRCSAGELDIVMLDHGELVFVEVKARTGRARGSAEEALTPAKARKVAIAAESWLAEHPEWEDRIWRIDLVAITVDPAGAVQRFTHITNAAQFDG